jgi:hypothetical protein
MLAHIIGPLVGVRINEFQFAVIQKSSQNSSFRVWFAQRLQRVPIETSSAPPARLTGHFDEWPALIVAKSVQRNLAIFTPLTTTTSESKLVSPANATLKV